MKLFEGGEMASNIKYANVIIDIVHEKLDKTFQYKIPDELQSKAVVGAMVVIAFGKGNKKRNGFIVDITDIPEYDIDKIKDISDVLDDKTQIESQLIQLAYWMKNKYGSTLIQALKAVLPVKDRIKEITEQTLILKLDKNKANDILIEYKRKHYTAKERLLTQLLKSGTISMKTARQELAVSAKTVDSMLAEGVISCESNVVYRNDISKCREKKEIVLNQIQKKAADTVIADVRKNNFSSQKTYLLHGVTGSGKTEVYIKIIDEVLKHGKQAIVLIPEIALTYQTVNRFTNYFEDKVSVLHSRLSKGEKYDRMQCAKAGDIQVMIGPRSALFTPFTNLGVIIIDEEHENSYKSENTPKYHARQAAIQRAKLCGALVVLGSATPSVESYYNAQIGNYELIELNERAKGNPLPNVYIEDLREELKEGNRSIFSRRLKFLMEDRLRKKEQIILFLNRRGYSGFISCRSCGEVIMCPHCDVSLSQHRNGRLICHYCGYERENVTVCPACGSKYISGFKAGTQQIESLVNKMFPQARVLRMDMDTTKGKKGHEDIIKKFANEEADILIGTQMIIKGHDFPKVTLVGILAADLSLNSPSYTGSEKTFQLLVQAAGRAGRADIQGDVVFQTYKPEHYSIVAAAAQDYNQFYEKEIEYRKMMNYPPAGKMLEVYIISKNEQVSHKAAEYVRLQVETAKIQNVIMIGPAMASIYKMQDEYRQVIYFKCDDEEFLIKVRNYVERVIKHFNNRYKSDVNIQFDFS